jgi:dsDNA-specific endonuclease/ATPase MutS2
MLELKRFGNEVYYGDKKLTIVAQASKGEGKEVVKIDGLPGSNGQKWLSLSKLQEGLNVFNDNDLARRNYSGKGYELTEEEQAKIDELTNQIDAIIEEAKKRYVPPVKKKPEQMNESELLEYIARLEKLAGLKRIQQ